MSLSMFKKLAADPMAPTITQLDHDNQASYDAEKFRNGTVSLSGAVRRENEARPLFTGKSDPASQAAVDATQASISKRESNRANDSVGVMAPGFVPKPTPAARFVAENSNPANIPTPAWGVKPDPSRLIKWYTPEQSGRVTHDEPAPAELSAWDKAKAWGNSGDTFGMNNWQLGAAGLGLGAGAYALYKLLNKSDKD